MPGIKAAFGLGHPFFDTACELRQKQHSIQQIVESAREAGYSDLTWAQIRYGLAHAPADLFLPTRTARYLRERYETLEKTYDSYTSMRDLALAALQQVADIEEELDNPEITLSRRGWLETQLWRWYGRAYEWSYGISEVQIKLMQLGLEHRASTPVERPEDTDEHLSIIVQDFKDVTERLALDASSAYGKENVSLPIDIEEDDDADEEED